jgi:hypothetical protein
MGEDKQLYCVECGERVKEDASPGVYLHDTEDVDDGYDLDEDHAATPDYGDYGATAG